MLESGQMFVEMQDFLWLLDCHPISSLGRQNVTRSSAQMTSLDPNASWASWSSIRTLASPGYNVKLDLVKQCMLYISASGSQILYYITCFGASFMNTSLFGQQEPSFIKLLYSLYSATFTFIQCNAVESTGLLTGYISMTTSKDCNAMKGWILQLRNIPQCCMTRACSADWSVLKWVALLPVVLPTNLPFLQIIGIMCCSQCFFLMLSEKTFTLHYCQLL